MSVVVSLESPHCSCPYFTVSFMLFDASTMEFGMLSILNHFLELRSFFLAIFDDCNSSWGQHLIFFYEWINGPGRSLPLPQLSSVVPATSNTSSVRSGYSDRLASGFSQSTSSRPSRGGGTSYANAANGYGARNSSYANGSSYGGHGKQLQCEYSWRSSWRLWVDVGFLLEALEAHKLLQLGGVWRPRNSVSFRSFAIWNIQY